PNMKLIGSLSSVSASPVPEDLENFMESSRERGVVLVSMGTIFEFPESSIPTLLAENAIRISKRMQSRPKPPSEALVQWIEYVTHNDVSHLKPEGLDMPWYQYYLVDVIVSSVFCIYSIFKISACLKELVMFNVMNYLAYSIKQEFNIRPDLGFYELMLSPEMTLVAGDFAVDYARPIPPNMKLIGPLSCAPASPLPEDLENFMESSGEHGVVLVSMGTIFEFPESLIPTLVAGFKRLEQKILWKTKLNVKNPPDNVKIVRWMPQNDILGHPKLRVFITHGGSKSIYEASYHGVPLIGIPIQAEQQLNIGKAKAAGVAIGLERNDLTPDIIVESVTEITTNPWYKGNMSRISKSIQSRPISPREALVQWVEYI
ncbi:uncharacterized protein TRIADDRAFT_13360, partial [Trichoplax adhaerens]